MSLLILFRATALRVPQDPHQRGPDLSKDTASKDLETAAPLAPQAEEVTSGLQDDMESIWTTG